MDQAFQFGYAVLAFSATRMKDRSRLGRKPYSCGSRGNYSGLLQNVMARGNKEQTPDLFSVESTGGPSAAPPTPTAIDRPSSRAILPKDLPRAMRYLADQELDRLVQAAMAEAKRRERPIQALERPPEDKPSAGRKVEPPTASLTRGQVNAVRAAFKAGVSPSRIARRFGPSQADVRQALATNKT
jgi:hypothetical protein